MTLSIPSSSSRRPSTSPAGPAPTIPTCVRSSAATARPYTSALTTRPRSRSPQYRARRLLWRGVGAEKATDRLLVQRHSDVATLKYRSHVLAEKERPQVLGYRVIDLRSLGRK